MVKIDKYALIPFADYLRLLQSAHGEQRGPTTAKIFYHSEAGGLSESGGDNSRQKPSAPQKLSGGKQKQSPPPPPSQSQVAAGEGHSGQSGGAGGWGSGNWEALHFKT